MKQTTRRVFAGTMGVSLVIGAFVAFSPSTDVDAMDPGGVSGAAMWYKADSAGNTNAQWNDFSGSGHDLTQGTAGNQPALTTNSINFNPAYVFDGSDDVFSMPTHGVGGSEPMSAFFAAESNTAGGGWRYFNEFGDDTPSIGQDNGKPELYVRGTSPISNEFATQQVGTPHMYGFISPNANNQDRVTSVDDNEQTQNVTSGTYTTSSGRSGNSFGSTNGSSGTSWQGPIAEAIYFNKVLTAGERLHVVSYLGIKYGITRDQGTSGAGYVDSDTTTIWNADSTFKNDIAGIGRDDLSTLNQKQSKSVNDDSLVAIGHGDIAATNQDNTNDFSDDQTFLMWGNDDGSTTSRVAVSDTTYERMERIWKSVPTNSPGSVKVQIPTSEAGDNDTMLISDVPTFGDTAQAVPMSVNGDNYEATVATLSSGTQYFTFAENIGSDIELVSKAATDIGGTAITEYTPGQPLQYELSVSNNGPKDASSTITVTDTLPTDIVPTQATGGGWTCNIAGQTVTCTRSALNNGVTAPEIIIEASIASSVTGQKVNTASASYADDPDTNNNDASVTLDAAPEADLSITKAHTGTPTAGNPLTYDFTVTNDGPSDVSSFTVTDDFSPNTFSSATPEVNCTGSTNVSCDAASPLAAGDTRSFSITIDVDAGGTITNTATVAPPAGTTDPNNTNNSADDDTDVNVSTDLAISKSHTGNFTAGDNNDFTINVTNNGPSDAPTGSITITDTLDEDFSYTSTATGTNWTCNSPPATTVSCTYNAALTSGSTTPNITLTVAVDPIVKGTTTNTATVSGTTPDPTPGNNSSTDNITIDAEADLGIVKTAVDPPFTPGTQEQFTFSVVNNGPSADTPTYTITDTLPAGLTYASYSGPADCSMSSGTSVSCTGGGIGVGDPAQVTTITVDVDASASGSVNNTATVAPDPSVTDPTPGNDSDTISMNFEPNADLSITKTPPGSMTAGDTADYTLTTTNDGPSDVSSYTITDDLDPSLTFQSSTPGGLCSVTGTTTQGGQELTCTGGAITASGQDAITITVAVASTATSGSTISNTATVATPAGVNDPTPGNNTSAQVDNTVDAEADIAVDKSHTGNFSVGGNGTFTIEVTNTSPSAPSDADTVTVTDVLPDGLTYVSATSPGAACNNAGQTVTCTIGPTMSHGDTVDITLDVTVDADVTASSIENTASVSSATNDPTPGNNSNSDTVTIDTAEANLTATKTAQDTLTAGKSATYRFEVTNDGGPDNAGNVTISDTLPSYLTYQSFESVSGGTWDCEPSSNGVTCTLPVLDVDDTAAVDVTVLVDQDAPTPAENDATVTFNGTDPSPVTLDTSDNVSYEADLALQLTHDSETYHSGDTVTYTYTVINHGPSRAKDVVLTDSLPEGLTFESIIAATGERGENSFLAQAVDTVLGTTPASAAPNTPFDCNNSGQDITCSADTLFVGTYTITMTAQIGDSFTGNLTTNAQIVSSTFDPNMGNNDATSTISDITARPGGIAGALSHLDDLADTGQNPLTWIASALALIATAGGAIWWRRRTIA